MGDSIGSIHVLHVDDSADFAEMTATFLEREDGRIEVTTATSANEGMEELAERGYDIVISDYDMPRRDGIEFLESVREKHPDLPFILFTGKGSEEVASEAIAAGVTDYFQKEPGTDQYSVLANKIVNVAQKRRAQEQLARERTRHTTLFENAPAPVIAGEIDPDEDRYLVTDVNAAFEKVFGFDATEILGEDVSEVIVPETKQDRHEEFLERARRGDPVRAEVTRETTDGPREFILHKIPFGTTDGNADGWYAWYTDITDRKRRERNLQTERDRVAALFENTTNAIVRTTFADGTPTVQEVNPAFEEIFGYREPDIVGESLDDHIVPPDEQAEAERINRRVQEGDTAEYEVERVTADGERRTFILRTVPIESDERDRQTFAVYDDVTDRKAYERGLEALHDTTVTFQTADTKRAVRQHTITAAEHLGFDAAAIHAPSGDELVVQAASEMYPMDVGTTVPRDDGIAGATYQRGESRYLDDPPADIAETIGRHDAVLSVPIGDYGVFQAVTTTPDAVEERDQELVELLVQHTESSLSRIDAEREMREKSNLLDQLCNQLPVHLYVKDEEARHVITATMEEHDPIGKTDRELFPETGEETYQDDVQVIETEEPIINKEMYFPPTDSWTLTSKVPWYDEDGEVQGLMGVTRNIDERKEYEQQLERKNERLEEFASIVSHDLRNPLNLANNHLELLREECTSQHIEKMASLLDRMETIIDSTLTLARAGDAISETAPIELSTLANECWRTIETADATLTIGATGTVDADEDRLRHLFENLFRNAIDHGGEDVAIRVGVLDESAGFYVEDDGAGIIPESDYDHVFESGYSTSSDGIGLGLSIVKTIAEAHGWEITVTDSEDGGARFEITGVTITNT